jgi:hypothetical protein
MWYWIDKFNLVLGLENDKVILSALNSHIYVLFSHEICTLNYNKEDL